MTRHLMCALVCLMPAIAAAQNTPVVFVHGLNSGGATWQSAADHFAAQLAITPYRPDLSWTRPYGEQANELQSSLGSLPGSAIAVGHSNGGLIARQWSRSRPLAGIVTVGSPHGGAPLIDNLPFFVDYVVRTMRAVWSASTALSIMEWHSPSSNWSWLAYQLAVYTDYTGLIVDSTVSGLAAAGLLATESAVPVLSEMRPGSSTLRELNSGGNLSREASEVPVRVGIVSSAPTYGGVFRAIAPDSAHEMGNLERALAYAFLILGVDVQLTAEPGDPKAMDAAMTMYEAASYLFDLDFFWCSAVSMPRGSIGCRPNDGVVSVDSQIYPGGVNFFTPADAGPAHNRETRDGAVRAWLDEVLVNYMHLQPPSNGSSPPPPPDSPAPPPPSSSSGPSMQQNAGIRGCDNYSDWGATYQPTPEACSAYCASNGADACEWEAGSGGCWVEFGDGCYVQDGFGGWWAATMNGTSSHAGAIPLPPRAANASVVLTVASVMQLGLVAAFMVIQRVRRRAIRRRLMHWLACEQPA
jgi:pimeloyl-ACP methyl ester carboxylesterase